MELIRMNKVIAKLEAKSAEPAYYHSGEDYYVGIIDAIGVVEEVGMEELIRAAHQYEALEWHNLKEDPGDLPKENEEVIVRVNNGIFKYAILVYLNGDWKGYGLPVNIANIIEWSYINEEW